MQKNKNVKFSERQTKPIRLKSNLLEQELEKELLLYDLKRDKVFCLNETSMIVWNLCDGEKTVEDIRRQVSLQLKTDISDEMIWLALDLLKNEKLLSNHQEITINFSGLSRRAVIKKVGLSTMAALPLVLTILSPNAAAAQSLPVCNPTFCVCSDLSCISLGTVALLQTPCVAEACNGGGVNCRCVGNFFCLGPNERFGMCGLV